jgi:hypothetical protein
VIINGFLSEKFKVENGIRQGCPLSAMLYVLAVEPLSICILKAIHMQGFVLPNNMEMKLVQHVDDVTMFLKNEESIVFAIKCIKLFGEISGSILNKTKSFIIKIGQSNEAYTIEEIPVLKNTFRLQMVGNIMKQIFDGEYRKILGIYFCASIKQYVYKNWQEAFKKCSNVIDMWEKEHLSIIGRVLVLNVKVIPKLFYILQSIEPMRYWEKRFNSLFHKFIGAGSSSIPLTILEWGRDEGGLGLFSLMHKARSLRLNYIKNFLCRVNSSDLSPINPIVGYYLDIPITSRYRPTMRRTGQVCYGGEKKVIDRGNMRKTFFQYFLDDIVWFTRMEHKFNSIDHWSQKDYYKQLIEYSAKLVRENNRGYLKIDRLGLNSKNEKELWKNVFLNSLCTKVQAFNLKVVHEALPTMEVIGGRSLNKWCYFCKEMLNNNVVENDEHILLECPIAKSVWHCINERLKAAYMNTIVINKENIFYKIGQGKPQTHLVSEVNWALWTNRCSNTYENKLNSHTVV